MPPLWQNANIISIWGLVWQFIDIDWNMEKWKTDWDMTKLTTWAKELGGYRWQETVKGESLWINSFLKVIPRAKQAIYYSSKLFCCFIKHTHINYHIKLFLVMLWSNNECVTPNMSLAKRSGHVDISHASFLV